MAAVANCPQCEHELLIPDGTDSLSWAKCPTCRAFFQLRDAVSRDVPQLVLLDSESSDPPDNELAEPPAQATESRIREPFVSGDADTVVETGCGESETEVAPASPSVDEILSRYKQDLDRLAAGLGEVPTTSATEAMGISPLAEPSSRQIAGDTPVADPHLTESSEPSAQGLDQWFRSAETVADLPATTGEPSSAPDDTDFISRKTVVIHAQNADVNEVTANLEQEEGKLPNESESKSDWSAPFTGEPEAVSGAPAAIDDELPDDIESSADVDEEVLSTGASVGATVELSADALHHMQADADFEVEQGELDEDRPTWDDPDRMERLLADVEAPAVKSPTIDVEHQSDLDDELEYASDDVGGAVEQGADADYEIADDDSAADTEPVVTAILTSEIEHRRHRSPVMMLAGTAVGGVVGLGLGYLVLLWGLGPDGDFLSAARWIPSAMLPASFQSTTSHMAASAGPTSSPKSLIDDVAANAEAATTVAAESDSAKAPDSREMTASYEAPATPPTQVEKSEPTEHYADVASASSDSPEEPLNLDVESAAPISSRPAIIAISDAPTVTIDQLAAGLSEAKQAQGDLLRGSLGDPTVQRAKGLSYTKLSQLADLVTFANREMSNAEADSIKGDATALFRETLADPQIRREVGYIASKWIESPHRKIGGVFLAGNVESASPLGPLAELRVDMGAGGHVIVVAPAELVSRLGAEPGAIAVAGSIIDNPSQRIEGYNGSATSVVWAGDLIPLD